jgi:ferredoxin--NADP+ reductase
MIRQVSVIARRDWDTGLFTLTLDARLAFEPGQWVNLGLDRDGELLRRSYSIASAPGAPLEVFVVEVEGGALTPALACKRVGDTIAIDDEPRGFFTLEHVPEGRDLWLVATGTGIGPFLSIVRSGVAADRFERIFLAHGVRHARQLGYRDELEKLAAESAERLRYLPTTSRERHEGLLSGRLTEVLADGRLERGAGAPFDPQRSQVMLCGNPAMIEDMMAGLAKKGLKRHRRRDPGHITTEKYWSIEP